jgi:histidine ammonia-lyase
MPESERFLHHGLKGLHQSVSALTSDLLSQSIPNSIFSRSSESHNQDKVSLGMTGAVKAEAMIDMLYTIQSMYFICLAQALDIREITLQSEGSKDIYEKIRKIIPTVRKDMALGDKVNELKDVLKNMASHYERTLPIL